MRTIASFIITVFLFGVSLADNPIVQTIYTADPAPMVYNDRVYVYTSHDEDELVDGFFTMRDWRCYSSDDMVNWTDHGKAASLEDFSWAGDNGAWAPQGIYRNGKFYLYCPLHMNGIGVLVSDSPYGPFTDPLGEPLINNSSADIDPTVFIDDDGQAYLYWGNPDLYYVRLNEDMVSYSGNIEQIPLTVESFGARSDDERPTSYEEGPWFYKRNDTYYMVYAGGPISEHIAYSTSPDPTGPWTYGGVIMPAQGGSFTNHPGVIDFAGNSYLFYHNAALPGGGGFHRSVCVEEFDYNADGSIPRIDMTEAGVQQVKNLNPYDTIQAETICWESGVETDVCTEGGLMVTSISEGDYIKVEGVDFGAAASTFNARAASGSSGGSIELHLGSREGTLVGTCDISGTGGWGTWETFQCELTGCSGVEDLYLVFRGSGEPFRLNWYRFSGASGYLLTVNTTGAGMVNRDPEGTAYEEGASVTLTAEPDEGWEFNSWSGDGVSGSDNPVTVTMDSDKTVSALFARSAADGNLVLNSDFSSGDSEWTLNVWDGDASGEVQGGEYLISINSIGAENHQIQLVQPGLFLEEGVTYQVSFNAYAASERQLEVNVEMADDPWDSYLPELEYFDLTTEKESYSFTFTMEDPTDVNGRLAFNAGSSVEDVYIDNVSVKLYTTSVVNSKRAVKNPQIKVNSIKSSVQLEIMSSQNTKPEIKVYDLSGKLVRSVSVQADSKDAGCYVLDFKGVRSGLYIVNILLDEKLFGTEKVILSR